MFWFFDEIMHNSMPFQIWFKKKKKKVKIAKMVHSTIFQHKQGKICSDVTSIFLKWNEVYSMLHCHIRTINTEASCLHEALCALHAKKLYQGMWTGSFAHNFPCDLVFFEKQCNHICDMIKGNESHVGNIQFWLFTLSHLSIFTATFWFKPYLNWTSGSIDVANSFEVQNNIKHKHLSPILPCNSESIFPTSDSFP